VTAELKRPLVKPDDAWTVRRVIEWTTSHLKKHGSESPRLDAEILLAHARGCPRIELYTGFDSLLTDEERSIMRELVRRRAQAEPVAYLVGHREFFSLDFRVTPDVLIPRPDTETLVVELLEIIRGLDQPRVLDVGTGSGCISIAAAVNCPKARFTAVDLIPAALKIAEENARRHLAADRIRFLEGDLFAPLDADDSFDVIASNPPYIREDELSGLQEDVRRHEPRAALVGGDDGLAVLRRLVSEAPGRLVPGGHLLTEISPEQAGDVRALFEATGKFREIGVIKDLAGQARVVRAVRAHDSPPS